jgi:hypothetical protein
MAFPTLIYCADGNKRLAQIAIDAGFAYGARLPARGLHHPPYFADQDWKNPDRVRYMTELEKHRPAMATVLDWEREEQRDEVLSWAEEAAQYVKRVLVVPKVIGGIETLPRRIGGAAVVLAYSVPTKYGGTFVPIWEFEDRPVHLLGGSPHKQMELCYYLNVVSVDGNMHQRLAVRHCQFWVPGTARYARNRWWPTLKEANDGMRWPGDDALYEAFARSCSNIIRAWKRLWALQHPL